MTEADWEHGFEELMKSNLIDVPKDYYADVLFFTDHNRLTDMFTDMETENLQMIQEQQEAEQAYDTLLQRE